MKSYKNVEILHTHTHTHTHTGNLKNEKEKAITLVAVVITIIILLILAGITIMSLKNNGIIDKATKAKNKYINAQIEEEQYLNNLENRINNEEDYDILSILKKYSIEDIISNKDDVLKRAFEDRVGTNYVLENYLQELANSKEAIVILAESKLAYEKVMTNE